MLFSLSAWFEQLNTTQKFCIFKVLGISFSFFISLAFRMYGLSVYLLAGKLYFQFAKSLILFLRVEIYSGGSWRSLVSNQRFIATLSPLQLLQLLVFNQCILAIYLRFMSNEYVIKNVDWGVYLVMCVSDAV